MFSSSFPSPSYISSCYQNIPSLIYRFFTFPTLVYLSIIPSINITHTSQNVSFLPFITNVLTVPPPLNHLLPPSPYTTFQTNGSLFFFPFICLYWSGVCCLSTWLLSSVFPTLPSNSISSQPFSAIDVIIQSYSAWRKMEEQYIRATPQTKNYWKCVCHKSVGRWYITVPRHTRLHQKM